MSARAALAASLLGLLLSLSPPSLAQTPQGPAAVSDASAQSPLPLGALLTQARAAVARGRAADMFGLLEELNREGKTVLFVTHDRELAARAPRVIEIRDGVVVDG